MVEAQAEMGALAGTKGDMVVVGAMPVAKVLAPKTAEAYSRHAKI